MDGQHPHFANLRDLIPRRVALSSAAAALALLLAGCGDQRVDALEQRLNSVEAKADAADKRAKSAESLATQTQPIVQPDPAPQNDLDPNEQDAGDGSVPDGGDPDVPPPPMADNGKA
jgi:hypothetical protein